MVKSVIREHHYPPEIIDSLYYDNVDYKGIEWLYNDIKEVVKELNKKK